MSQRVSGQVGGFLLLHGQQCCIANSTAEEKQVAVFLTAIGGPTYKLMRKLLLPDAPKDKSLAKLKSLFMHTSSQSL